MSVATFDKERVEEKAAVAAHMSNINNLLAADVASTYSQASSNLSVMRKLRMDKSKFSVKVNSLAQ